MVVSYCLTGDEVAHSFLVNLLRYEEVTMDG